MNELFANSSFTLHGSCHPCFKKKQLHCSNFRFHTSALDITLGRSKIVREPLSLTRVVSRVFISRDEFATVVCDQRTLKKLQR